MATTKAQAIEHTYENSLKALLEDKARYPEVWAQITPKNYPTVLNDIIRNVMGVGFSNFLAPFDRDVLEAVFERLDHYLTDNAPTGAK